MSDATLRWQAQRIEELEAELANYRSSRRVEDGADSLARIRRGFRCSTQQARVVERLYRARGHIVSHRALIDAMYAGEDEPIDPDNVLKIQVCRLRHTLTIMTHHRLGYALTDESVARVENALQRKQWRAA